MIDMVTKTEAENAVKILLEYLEGDAQREGLQKTPQRVIESWDEIFSGYSTDSEELLPISYQTRKF